MSYDIKLKNSEKVHLPEPEISIVNLFTMEFVTLQKRRVLVSSYWFY